MAELKIDHLSRREQFMLTLAMTSIQAMRGQDFAVETINYIVKKADLLEPVKSKRKAKAPMAAPPAPHGDLPGDLKWKLETMGQVTGVVSLTNAEWQYVRAAIAAQAGEKSNG